MNEEKRFIIILKICWWSIFICTIVGFISAILNWPLYTNILDNVRIGMIFIILPAFLIFMKYGIKKHVEWYNKYNEEIIEIKDNTWKKSLYIDRNKDVQYYYEYIDGNYKIRYFAVGYFYLEIYDINNRKIVNRVMFGRDYFYKRDMENPNLRKECLEEARRVIDIYENPSKNVPS